METPTSPGGSLGRSFAGASEPAFPEADGGDRYLPSDGPATLHPPLSTFRARRERLLSALGDAVAVVPAAAVMHRSRDTESPFRQDSDFYYLTGFGEPDALAVLTPHDEEHRFTLFVRPRDLEREVWSGKRAGEAGAREHFAADAAYPLEELDERLPELVKPADRIVYPLGRSPELDDRMLEIFGTLRTGRPRSGQGPIGLHDLEAALAPLRLSKDRWELERIRAAAGLSARGQLAAAGAVGPGVGEWEVAAALEGVFRRAGGVPAFPSIVGSGPNATVLHYVANDRRLQADELVLVDAGAELGMYAGDITRTYPVSGRFTAAQRALYEVVLAAEEAAIAEVRPGTPNTRVHEAAVRTLVDGMLDLGILRGDADTIIEEEEYKPFFMHRTSHWLGLDVHDVGQYREGDADVELGPGMALTVEPGIYVAPEAEGAPDEFRGVGIRIEDDVLVTADGHEVLTRDVPVEPDEVEALVRG
ncbi:aminopeptidase P N-terminal domain-containing protein [soil metagenome]